MTKSHTEWGEEYNLKQSRVRLDEIYADWTEEREGQESKIDYQREIIIELQVEVERWKAASIRTEGQRQKEFKSAVKTSARVNLLEDRIVLMKIELEKAEAEVVELKKILHRISDELTLHKVPPGADHTTVVDHIISMCNRALFTEVNP